MPRFKHLVFHKKIKIVYTPTGGSTTINVFVYTQVGGSTQI